MKVRVSKNKLLDMRPFDDQDRNDTNKEVIYKEKNGYKWSFKEPNKTVKTPCRNIIVKLPSIKPYDRFQFYCEL